MATQKLFLLMASDLKALVNHLKNTNEAISYSLHPFIQEPKVVSQNICQYPSEPELNSYSCVFILFVCQHGVTLQKQHIVNQKYIQCFQVFQSLFKCVSAQLWLRLSQSDSRCLANQRWLTLCFGALLKWIQLNKLHCTVIRCDRK